MPAVSIIIASYNYENYIKETIQSVLNQTFEDWEMIIVDDGSKDNSIEVIKEYCSQDNRIKFFQHENGENKGLIETLKLGIEKASSNWLVFVESDDFIEENYLEEKFRIIQKNSKVNFIFNDVNMFGDIEIIKSHEKYIKKIKTIVGNKDRFGNFLRCFKSVNIIPTFSAVMLRRELILDVDWNCVVLPWIDYYLWVQIAQKNKLYYCSKQLTNWRIHRGSFISQRPEKDLERKFRYIIKKIVFYKNPFLRYLNCYKYYKKDF